MPPGSRKHILLLANPAYGHIIPLLELGKKIVRHHDVTFASSECLVKDIQIRELVSAVDDFPLVGIPDGFVELTAKNIVSRDAWLAAFNCIGSGIRNLLRAIPTKYDPNSSTKDALGITKPIDFVIGDNMLAGSLAVCHDRSIPYYFFNTMSATMTLGALFVDEDYPTLPESEDDFLAFSELPPPGAPLPPMPQLIKDTMLEIAQTTRFVSGIVVNSVKDIEQEVLVEIKKFPLMKEIPVFFVGPLMPVAERTSTRKMEQQEQVRKWLDGKMDNSVVYVSFGSIAAPVPTQLTALATALLNLGKPFIWSLPHAEHQHLPKVIASKLSGRDSASENLFLILPWAPQKTILQHPATAVFLSHCGWNSTIESVASGVPVVAWPMFSDQKLNGQWLVEHSTAIMIQETGMKPKRVVPAEEIESAIRTVGWTSDSPMSSYRQAAQTWKAKLAVATGSEGSSEIDFARLIQSFN